jgi:hypothetical protein
MKYLFITDTPLPVIQVTQPNLLNHTVSNKYYRGLGLAIENRRSQRVTKALCLATRAG